VLPGGVSAQEPGVGVGVAEEGDVKVTVAVPRVIVSGSLLIIVNVSVVGLELLELTVKLALPFESVVTVPLSAPILPPLITSPESPELFTVIRSPGRTLELLSLAITEIIEVVEPSAGIEPWLTEILELPMSASFAKTLPEENKLNKRKIATLSNNFLRNFRAEIKPFLRFTP